MGEEGMPERRLQRVDRSQSQLRPVVVEDLIGEDHPARAIWGFVGALDLTPFVEEVRSVEGVAGRPALDPQLLISMWVYSYSRGISSAREIERLCDYDPAFQWLTGMESVSAHTLSDFRVGHAEALRELFVQVLGLLSAEGLITLERVMQDGTRVRALASSKRFRRKDRIEGFLEEAREAVRALEAAPEEETTLRRQRARERAVRETRERLESAMKQFEHLKAGKSQVDRVSTTDPEARIEAAEGGTAPSYNVQIVTDAAQTLIVDIEATQAGSDYRQLQPGVDRVEQAMKRKPEQVVVDGGYISSDNIVAMADRGVDLVGPEPKGKASEANRKTSYRYRGVNPDYESSKFRYEPASNTYRCPQGKRLTYEAKYPSDGTMHYRYQAAAKDCLACPAKPVCCPDQKCSRTIER
jgi:transposase